MALTWSPDTVWLFLQKAWWFLVVLGVLVAFHELGHFLAARWVGVKVLKFSLGFGPKLFGRKMGETEYLVSAIPLGGYVKLFGEDETEATTQEDRARSFAHKGLWGKVLIVAGDAAIGLEIALAGGVNDACRQWRRRGFAMGIRQTGVPVGGVLAATLWPWVATAWGWRATYGLAGAMAIFGTAVVVLSYFDPARETGSGTGMRSLRNLMTERRLWLLALTYNGQIVAQYSVTVYLVLFFHEALGFSLIVAAGLLALVNAVAIGGRIGWGLASDALFGGARRPVLLIIIALTFAGMLMAAALPAGAPLGLTIALAILLGLSAFSWTGMYGTLAIELAGSASAASAVAWVHVLGGVGSLGGAPLFGYLVDHTGSYRVAWLAVALAVLVWFIATLALREGSPYTDATATETSRRT
jgi:predicted MFS family arabinose efflux permease